MEYKYNSDGLRVEKIAEGNTTRYLYEYDKIVLEVDGKGKQLARNIHGVNPIAREVSSTQGGEPEKAYYLYNGHADVTALVSKSGSVCECTTQV